MTVESHTKKDDSKFVTVLAMKAYRGILIFLLHLFLTSTLDGGDYSISRSGRFNLEGRAPGTDRIGGLSDPRVCFGEDKTLLPNA
jgi:hypothetical protein